MLPFQRLIISVLAVFLVMACNFLIPPASVATTTPAGAVMTVSTYTPIAASVPGFGSFQPITRVGLATSERVLDMMVEAGDVIWLVTDSRVMQYRLGAWTDYLPKFGGTPLGMDSDHRVWVVSDNRTEVSLWDGSALTVMGREAGWEPPNQGDNLRVNWSLAEDAPGNVWLADGSDVRMFDGVKWRVFGPDDLEMTMTEEQDVFSETTLVFLKKSGFIWANNCHWIGPGPFGGGGARWYDGHVWQGSDSPVASGCATVVSEDGLGNIWLGVDDNLWRFDPLSGNWEQFPAPEPPEGGWFGFINDLALDAAGDPWPELVLCGGASCYTGNVRYHLTGTDWLQIGDIGTDNGYLYFDATGQGWVFTSSDVLRVAGNQVETAAELSILKVAVAPSGRLWIAVFYEGEIVIWTQAPDG